MAVTTVAQLAAELNRPAAALLEQLQSAGVSKASTDDALTEADKERLLDHLRSAHGTAGGERKKITLTRKSTSEIKQADCERQGAHDPGRGAQEAHLRQARRRRRLRAEAPPAPVLDEAELQRRELEAAGAGRTAAPPGRGARRAAPPARRAGARRARSRRGAPARGRRGRAKRPRRPPRPLPPPAKAAGTAPAAAAAPRPAPAAPAAPPRRRSRPSPLCA